MSTRQAPATGTGVKGEDNDDDDYDDGDDDDDETDFVVVSGRAKRGREAWVGTWSRVTPRAWASATWVKLTSGESVVSST